MSHGWKYESGGWWLLCDVCNKKIEAHKSKKRWDGFVVCPDDWEIRHPQDFIKPTIDKIVVPFTRPRQEDVFVDVCTLPGRTGIAGYAVAGCSIAGFYDDSLQEYHINIEDFFPAIAGLAVGGYSIAGTIESESNTTQGL